MENGLTYCYATSPVGSWIYEGTIVQNGINWIGVNNYGSIIKVLDKWYVVCHKATINSTNRKAIIESSDVNVENEKVIIPQVEMTSHGLSVNELNAFNRNNVNIVCSRANDVYIDGQVRNEVGLNPLKGLYGPNASIGFKYFNFGTKPVTDSDDLVLKLNCNFFQLLKANIYVALPKNANLEENWILIAEHTISDDFDIIKNKDYSISITQLTQNKALKNIGGLKDKLAVFVTFTGNDKNLCELIDLEFLKSNHPTPNPLNNIIRKETDKGKIVSVPSMVRVGESVKLSIEPKKLCSIKAVIVKDNYGKVINVNQNEPAVYAPASFNFFMPNTPITAEVIFNQ